MEKTAPETSEQAPAHHATHSPKNSSRRKKILGAVAAVLVLGLIGGGFYWYRSSKRIYTDKATISAPLITLSPEKPGVLKQIYVHDGETVDADKALARIQDDFLRSRTSGIVVDVANQIGTFFSPGMPVVTMIHPDDLRVVARIGENKGFSEIKIGQKASFTVDAFGSKEYEGTVDEIGKSALVPSVVFSISDKRATSEFIVKIKYDAERYPELLNGMSARVTIFK